MIHCILLLLLFATTAMAATPVPKDFAWSSTLILPADGLLYEIAVPTSVYRGVSSKELADVCIFNGRGEVVPFSLTTPPLLTVQKRVLLPHFPLPGKPRPGEKLSVRVERRSTGEIVTVSHGTPDAVSFAYLLDATLLTAAIESLELGLDETPDGFVGRVTVDASDDLEHWRTVTSTTLANLKREGSKIEQRQIQLSGVKARYLRLVQEETSLIINFTKVTATLVAATSEARRESLVIDVAAAPKQPGEYFFDLAGMMPVDRLRLLLPEKNSLVRGTFYSRSIESDPWIQRLEGVSYRLESRVGELISPALPLPANSDRYWKLKISEAGGGAGAAAVKVEVAWTPQKIQFLPRGTTPFILAFGSGRADTRALRGDDLLSSLPVKEAGKVQTVRAEAAEAVSLGGEAALKKEVSPDTRKKFVLWGALVAGVGILAWMALRLSRQMKREDV